jgi:hypothetical protein
VYFLQRKKIVKHFARGIGIEIFNAADQFLQIIQ